MKRLIRTLLLAGLAAYPGSAQEYRTDHNFLRASFISTQDDLRSFTGGKSNGYGFEAGRVFRSSGDFVSIQAYIGHLRVLGKRREDLGTTFNIRNWVLGADVRYDLPWQLTAFAGASANHWSADQLEPSTTLGTLKGNVPDSRAKIGYRVGVEYAISGRWSASMTYSFSEWRSELGKTRRAGYNPVNPSWVSISATWHF